MRKLYQNLRAIWFLCRYWREIDGRAQLLIKCEMYRILQKKRGKS